MAPLAKTAEPDSLELALGWSQRRPAGLSQPEMAAAGMTSEPLMEAVGLSDSWPADWRRSRRSRQTPMQNILYNSFRWNVTLHFKLNYMYINIKST